MASVYFLGEMVLGPWEKMWADALKANGFDVHYRTVTDFHHGFVSRILGSSVARAPQKFKYQVMRKWYNLLNERLLEELSQNSYDYFFCYNDCRLLPNTVTEIRKRVKKIIILLGDNPFFYTQDKSDFLHLVEHADVLLTADRVAEKMLNMFQTAQVIYTPAGSDLNLFHPLNVTPEQQAEFGCEVLCVGSAYGRNSLGHHRARVINECTDFDLRIYGNRHWRLFYEDFPGIRKCHHQRPLSQAELNIAQNCAKIYVTITNAWLVNGVPTRTYDAAASGTLVIAEHRDEYDELFPDDVVPTFKTLGELKEKVRWYLDHEAERQAAALGAHELLKERYQVTTLIEKLLPHLS